MVFVFILTLIYSIGLYYDTAQFGVFNGCDWWNLILYNFVHVNVIHLIINSSLFLLYWNMVKRYNLYFVIPILISVPAAAAMFSMFQEPTVGASSIVMAMIGIITVTLPQKQALKVLGLLVFSFATTGFFATHVNTLIHVYSFAFSSAVSLSLKKFIYDR